MSKLSGGELCLSNRARKVGWKGAAKPEKRSSSGKGHYRADHKLLGSDNKMLDLGSHAIPQTLIGTKGVVKSGGGGMSREWGYAGQAHRKGRILTGPSTTR